VVSYETFLCCNCFIAIQACLSGSKVVTDCVYLSATHAISQLFCKGSAVPLKYCVRNCFVTSWVTFLLIRLVAKFW